MGEPKNVSPFDLSAGVPNLSGELRPKPKFADRISKRVLLILGIVVAILLALFMAALDAVEKRQQTKPSEPAAQKSKPTNRMDNEVAPPPELLGRNDSPAPSLVAAGTAAPAAPIPETGTTVPGLTQHGKTTATNSPSESEIPVGNTGGLGDGGAPQSAPRKTPEQLAEERVREDRRSRMEQARKQGLSVGSFKGDDDMNAPAGAAQAVAANAAINKLLTSVNDPSGAARSGPATGEQGGDSEQQQKINFLKSASNDYKAYHPHMPTPARSPNELKGGSFIRMALQYGINSDLPGEVLARVTEDVYDTTTGCRLLIPGMSTARGKYDSKVALGQGRNLVTWTSMVFPDGSELNLGGAQAYDMSGAAGLEADVDNHYLRLFGLTFGMSLITAEVQMSAPQQSGGTGGGMTAQQSLAMALSQQYGQLGAQILGKYMAVQPTLRNEPGERFVVMVPATIVFSKVWRRRC